jgi:transposase
MIEVVQTRRHQGRPVSPRLRRSAMRNRNLAAAALHARGMTVRAIAGQLGTYGPSTVHTWISHERA